MPLFHVIEDASVILRDKRGFYRQAKVFRRGEDVYAGVGSGFVRLIGSNGTTCPTISYMDLDARGVTTSRIGNPKFFEVITMSAAA